MPVLPQETHSSIMALYNEALGLGHRSRPARTEYVIEKTAGTYSPGDVRKTLHQLLNDKDLAR